MFVCVYGGGNSNGNAGGSAAFVGYAKMWMM
jgi:hypothetical protein